MLNFQVSINDGGNTGITNEMTNVILQAAVQAIKTKAQELFLNCALDVNIDVNVTPIPDPT